MLGRWGRSGALERPYLPRELRQAQLRLVHSVEAKFELGAGAASSLHRGDAVIVVGHERDASFEGTDGGVVYRRVIDATHIGPDLGRATAVVTRTPRENS